MPVENLSARYRSVKSDKFRACAAMASYFGIIFSAGWQGVQYSAESWYSHEDLRPFSRQLLWTSEEPSRARRPKHLLVLGRHWGPSLDV